MAVSASGWETKLTSPNASSHINFYEEIHYEQRETIDDRAVPGPGKR